MKRRIVSAVLCFGLLLGMGSAYAAAGTGSDPLISLSYIKNIFLPEARKSLNTTVSDTVKDYRAKNGQPDPMAKSVNISGGGKVSLKAGQYFLLLSGSGELAVNSGEVVNASEGAVAKAGAVRTNCRYIVCEDASAVLSITEDAQVYCSYKAEVTPGDGKISPFSDVKRKDWFFDSVVDSVDLGLIAGITPTTYKPSGNLTLAQTIRLAASMNEKYYNGATVTQPSTEGQWYDSFVEYCFSKGIIDISYVGRSVEEYNAAITRREFLHIFYNALPASSYTAKNTVPDGAIPDVDMQQLYSSEIYTFYRAGIVGGYTNSPRYPEHAFGPESYITRAEVASVLVRMFKPEMRGTMTLTLDGN